MIGLFYLGIGIGELGHIFGLWHFPIPMLFVALYFIYRGIVRLIAEFYLMG